MNYEEAKIIADSFEHTGKTVQWIKSDLIWFIVKEEKEEYVSRTERIKYLLGFIKEKPVIIYEQCSVCMRKSKEILVTKKKKYGEEPRVVYSPYVNVINKYEK